MSKTPGMRLIAAMNVLELLAVANVERDFDAGARVVVAAAFEAAYIRAGAADDIGNSGDHSGTILGKDAQTHRKLRLRGIAAHSTAMRRSAS